MQLIQNIEFQIVAYARKKFRWFKVMAGLVGGPGGAPVPDAREI